MSLRLSVLPAIMFLLLSGCGGLDFENNPVESPAAKVAQESPDLTSPAETLSPEPTVIDPTETELPNIAKEGEEKVTEKVEQIEEVKIYVPPYSVIKGNVIDTDLTVKAKISGCTTLLVDEFLSARCNATVQEVFSNTVEEIAINDVIQYQIDNIEELGNLVARFEGVYFLSANKDKENVFHDQGNGYRFKYELETHDIYLKVKTSLEEES